MHVLGISYDPLIEDADLLARLAAGISGMEEASGSGTRIRVLPTRCMVGLPMLRVALCTRLRFVLAFGLRTISHLLLIVCCTVKVRSNEKGLEERVKNDESIFSAVKIGRSKGTFKLDRSVIDWLASCLQTLGPIYALPLLRSVSRDRTMKIFLQLSRVTSVLVYWESGPSNKVRLILQGTR